MADDNIGASDQQTIGPQAEGNGLSITNQRGSLNRIANGIATDISGQGDDYTTALNGVLTALTNKPGE